MTTQATKPDAVGPREVWNRFRAFLSTHQALRIILGGLLVALLLPTAGGVLARVAPGFGTQNDWVGGFADAGVFILGAVLEQFFAKYVSLNSFTETVIKTQQRGQIMVWPAQVGKRQIL